MEKLAMTAYYMHNDGDSFGHVEQTEDLQWRRDLRGHLVQQLRDLLRW